MMFYSVYYSNIGIKHFCSSFLIIFSSILIQKYKGRKSNIIFVATKSNLTNI